MQTKIIAFLLVSLFALGYCKKKDDDNLPLLAALAALASTTTSLGGSKAPGDVLSGQMAASLSTKTFAMTNETTGKSVSGTYRVNTSGFLTMFPSGSTTTGGYAILIPGIGLLAAPLSGYSSSGGSPTTSMRAEAYVDLSGADCSTIAGTYNLVQSASDNSGTTGNAPKYGTVVLFSGGTTGFSTPTLSDMAGGVPAALPSNGGSCSSARTKWTTETSFITKAGGMIIDLGTNNGALMGFKQDTTLNSTSALSGKTFIGFENNRGNSTTADNFVAYKITCSGTTCTAVDIDPATLSPYNTSTYTLTINSASNGAFGGTVTCTTCGARANNDQVRIAATTYNGKVILSVAFCAVACNTGSNKASALFTQQ